jgi:hypothetical protein
MHASDWYFNLVMGYTIMLLVLAIRAQERGRPAWQTGVREGTLLVTNEKTFGAAGGSSPPTLHQTYPPAVQYPAQV